MIASNRPSDTADESATADDREDLTAAVETVLQNVRRRKVLLYIAAQGGEASLSSLALSLAADGDETLSAIIEELHDCHIPKLAAHDLLEHESGGNVALLIEPDRAEVLVARAEDG